MIEERIMTAIERIDAGMARIEAAADRPRAATPASPPELGELRDRHASLRARVERAVAELDTLIRNG